ncbi:MAG TPA: DUF4912 domain-containing protein [Pirellulales bacterium]|nr:DUF4912 domain-containing protein [Pirellulales bacterium]
MTAQTLRARSLKDLADMARKRGVNGWHAMRKDQLVRALLHVAKRAGATSKSPSKNGVSMRNSRPIKRAITGRNSSAGNRSSARRRIGRTTHHPRITARLEQAKVRLMRAKILAVDSLDGRTGAPAKDRLVVMVHDPYWLHAYWELTPAGVVRAQAALGQHWHTAKPMLRVLEVSGSGSSTAAERVARDIAIHGGVKNWYIDVGNPPQTYRLLIGYLASNGQFFSLARSNTVSTPASTSSEKLDNHWTEVVENCDKIYAMSGGYSAETNSSELQEVLEERLRRPVGATLSNRYSAEQLISQDRTVRFRVETEMVIHGTTHPDAQVTLQGAPIKLRPDGSFSVRVDLPNRRQVIPLVAATKDGSSQRTIVLAVERNTKIMEPINREPTQ